MAVTVLRLGHRLGRDARITTHCGLVARAFGADEIIISGSKDSKVIDSINRTSKRWGGKFSARYEKNWKKVIREFKGTIVHLSMYGRPVQKKISEIREKKNLLIIVGGEKVPAEAFQLADYNIAVTNQPHSEVAALAVFLDRYFGGKGLDKKFKGGEISVVPQESGKLVV